MTGTPLFLRLGVREVMAASLVSLVPTAANAADSKIELTWNAPPECPGRDAVRDATEALVEERSANVHADAMVRRLPDGWEMTLTIESHGGKSVRSLRAPGCDELREAAAVLIAVAADAPHEGTSASEEPPPSPPPPALRAATPSRPDELVERPAGRTDRTRGDGVSRAWGSVGLGGMASMGVVPGLALGFGGWFAWLHRRLRIEAYGAYFPPARMTSSDYPIGGDFALALGGSRGCWAIVPPPLSANACAGGELGGLRGRGAGKAVDDSSDASGWWIAGTAGGLAAWDRGLLALQLRIDAVIPFVRDRFTIEAPGGDPLVHRIGAVGGRLEVGIGMRFP